MKVSSKKRTNDLPLDRGRIDNPLELLEKGIADVLLEEADDFELKFTTEGNKQPLNEYMRELIPCLHHLISNGYPFNEAIEHLARKFKSKYEIK